MVRIGAKANDSFEPPRRARRIVLPILLGVIVLIAVVILVRASIDTDDQAQDRSKLGPGHGPKTVAPYPAPVVGPGLAGPPATPAGKVGAGQTVASAATAFAPTALAPAQPPGMPQGVPPGTPRASAAEPNRAAGSGNPSGAPRPGTHPGPAANREARGAGNAGRAGASGARDGAAGASGKAGEQKLALADPSKRDAVWQRPAGEADASKLVVRFSQSGGATLRGRVVDSETGRPATGVAIEAHIGDAFMRTVSDAAGTFRMPGILPSRKLTVWIIGRSDTFVAERIDVTSPTEGETSDAGVVRLLRGDELAAHLEGWMGIFVTRRGRRNVIAAISPWSPADRAGLQVGDVLLSIEGRDVDGLGPRATGFLLRGPVGTKANVAVQSRDGSVHRYQLERVLR